MNDSEMAAASAGDPGPFKAWLCVLCGFVYDEAEGMPDHGIAPGTRWADVPADWICPDCSCSKVDFEMVEV